MATHQKKHTQKKGKHDFITAEEGETYAIIKSIKGDTRFDVEILRTGKITIAKARGALINGPGKQRIQINDIVLIQEGKLSFILTKYSEEDVKKLTKMGELVTYKPNSAAESMITFEDDAVSTDKIKNLEIDDEFIMGI
jgi:hypothetical protein